MRERVFSATLRVEHFNDSGCLQKGEKHMQKLLLIMYRKLISDGMKRFLENNPETTVYVEHIYENVLVTATTHRPDIVMLEIPESNAGKPEYYLKICAKIREALPICKLLLMCPENSMESRQAAVGAMRLGEIDDFIYFNVTFDYLLSKLEVLGLKSGGFAAN